MTGTRIYQGWRYTFDQLRAPKERWQATRLDQVLSAPSESGIKKLVDGQHERSSQSYGKKWALQPAA